MIPLLAGFVNESQRKGGNFILCGAVAILLDLRYNENERKTGKDGGPMRRENVQNGRAVGGAACRAFRTHPRTAGLLTAADGLLHGVFLLFVFFYLSADGEKPAALVWLVLAIAMYVFCLIPFRFYEGDRLRCLSEEDDAWRKGKQDYLKYLRVGLFRYLLGLLWGFPFLAALSLFLYGMEYLPFNKQGMMFESFAAAVGMEPSVTTGLTVFGVLMAVFLILFAFGWRRNGAMPYLPCRRLAAGDLLRVSKNVRRRGRQALLENALWNFVLFLPALIGAVLVLAPYAAGHVRLGGSLLTTVRGALRLIKTPLPVSVLLGLALAAVILYLPLMMLRRMRIAVIVRCLTEDLDEPEEAPHAP